MRLFPHILPFVLPKARTNKNFKTRNFFKLLLWAVEGPQQQLEAFRRTYVLTIRKQRKQRIQVRMIYPQITPMSTDKMLSEARAIHG